MNENALIVGLLLAGGSGRRMGGGDKCLRLLGGRPLLTHVINRLNGQVDMLVLNANGDTSRFSTFGLPVVTDCIPGMVGPLAGILSGMEWIASQNAGCSPMMLSVPTDGPFLPRDLVFRLAEAKSSAGAKIACARSGGRAHPPISLWDVDLAENLRLAMEVEGMRKIDLWTARHSLVSVDWSIDPFDPFFNANRPEDLIKAESLLM